MARRSACRLRVRDILEDPTSRYTKDHLLILCQQYHYSAGMLLLLQQLDFHDTILDYYMLYNEYEKVISFANEFGADDNSLWTKVVQFLAGPGERAGGVETEAQREEREGYLAQVLEIIEEKKFLSPLAVVQLLGSPLAGNVRFVVQNERKACASPLGN